MGSVKLTPFLILLWQLLYPLNIFSAPRPASLQWERLQELAQVSFPLCLQIRAQVA